MNHSQKMLASFRRRAKLKLADLGVELSGRQLMGQSNSEQLDRAFDLAVGAGIIHDDTNSLTLDERVEIAAFLLPVGTDEGPVDATPTAVVNQPVLSLAFSEGTVLLGSLEPLFASARVRENDARLVKLTLIRNNVPVVSTSSPNASMPVPLPVAAAGVEYVATAEYSNFPPQTVRRKLVPRAALLFGALPPVFTAEQVQALAGRLLPEAQVRLTFAGERQRMLVYLPPGVSLLKITQPSDNDADQTRAFLSAPFTLPGAQQTGTLLQSNTEFYSSGFTLDFFLTLAT